MTPEVEYLVDSLQREMRRDFVFAFLCGVGTGLVLAGVGLWFVMDMVI